MSKGKINIFVSIILLIFVAQAMMSESLYCDMPAGMMMQTQSDENHHEIMNHGDSGMEHDMQNMNHDMGFSMSSSVNDCCSGDSNCNMSSCISLAVSDANEIKNTSFPHHVIPFNFFMAPSQTSSSLYRPPILA